MQLLRTRSLRMAIVAAATLALLGGAVLGFTILARAPAAAAPSPSPQPTATPTAEPTRTPRPTPTASPTPTPEPEVARCPLNGLPIDGEPSATVVSVQIENHPQARPTRNLGTADMVLEAPVEGDTTRYTALFGCSESIGLTGPVRSARYYNVDVYQDLHVLTLGYGASGGALARFDAAGMPYVNGITGAWPWFRRYGTHPAPHNLYMDVEAARDALAAGSNASLNAFAGRVDPFRAPFTFDPDVELTGRAVGSVTIVTSRQLNWRLGWRWDAELGAWRRSDAGREWVDAATDQPITAGSVVVQIVTQSVVYGDPDPGGYTRREQHLVGSGNGTLYVQGQAIALRWSRPNAGAGTTWTYADSGDPVVLPPGRVWWEIIPTTASITEG